MKLIELYQGWKGLFMGILLLLLLLSLYPSAFAGSKEDIADKAECLKYFKEKYSADFTSAEYEMTGFLIHTHEWKNVLINKKRNQIECEVVGPTVSTASIDGRYTLYHHFPSREIWLQYEDIEDRFEERIEEIEDRNPPNRNALIYQEEQRLKNTKIAMMNGIPYEEQVKLDKEEARKRELKQKKYNASPDGIKNNALHWVMVSITEVDKKRLKYKIGFLQGGVAILANDTAAYWVNNNRVYAANGFAKTWSPKISYVKSGAITFNTVKNAVMNSN